MHTYIRTYVRTYVRACVRTYVRACVRAYVRTYIHVCACACIYIHTYILKSQFWCGLLRPSELAAADFRCVLQWFLSIFGEHPFTTSSLPRKNGHSVRDCRHF